MKMFKKSILAAAVTGIAATAIAGEINDARQNANGVALPYYLGVESTLDVGTINVLDGELRITTGTDYIENDVVEVTIGGGAEIDAANSSPVLHNLDTGNPGASFVDIKDGNTLRFRVNSGAGVIGEGDVLEVRGVALKGLTGAAITASSRAVSLNASIGAYDASSSQRIYSLIPQYNLSFDADDKAEVSPFNGTIDVSSLRRLFEAETNGDNTEEDTLTFVIDDNTPYLARNEYAPAEVTHVITGSDFSYFMEGDANEDGELSSAELSAYVDVSSNGDDDFTVSVNESFTEITVTQEVNGTVDTDYSVVISAAGEESEYTMTPQSFTADMVVENAAGTLATTVLSGTSIGGWDLNGANVYVPYMPYGPSLSQIIYISNNGSLGGEVEVEAFDQDGNTYGPYSLGTVEAKSILKLTGALEDALAADGFTSGKLAFDITVNAPAGNIEVYTGYNAGNDRGLVINDSNK